jgi:hypothetical protein
MTCCIQQDCTGVLLLSCSKAAFGLLHAFVLCLHLVTRQSYSALQQQQQCHCVIVPRQTAQLARCCPTPYTSYMQGVGSKQVYWRFANRDLYKDTVDFLVSVADA